MVGADDLDPSGAPGRQAADDVVMGEVDVDEVVVGAGLGDAFDVIELLGDGEGAFEAEIVAWLEVALTGAHDEGAGDAGGREEAGHVGLDARRLRSAMQRSSVGSEGPVHFQSPNR